MDNAGKGKFGEQFVVDYLEAQGYVVRKRIKGERGFDLLAQKDNETLKIEVKTSNNHKGGIPDMHDSEFVLENGEWKLIADYIYIVRLDGDKPDQLDIVSKAEVDSYSISHKTVTAIRTTKLDRDLSKQRVGKTINLS